MLGLVSHVNLMDALIHPRRHNAINLSHFSRPNNSFIDSSESDTIIEDTPDSPVECIDYSHQPPDIGRTIEINLDGSETSPSDSQKLNKRVVCFSYQNSDSDPDDYPFHAVTYGESESCWGLPYNDHNYASCEPNPKLGSESDDRLSLLAKLALAKDNSPNSMGGSVNALHSDSQTSWVSGENTVSVPVSKTVGLIEVNPILSPTKRSVICNSEAQPAPSNGQLLVTTASYVSSVGSRTILFSASGNINPPLQIHRVTSSLTPHVVLRTGAPALQIATSAPRQLSTDAGDSVRCICGNPNLGGFLIQCNHCRIWHHSECIPSVNKGHLSNPYVCETCQSHPKPATLPRPKVASYGSVVSTPNSSIRISRTPLTTNTPQGRIYVSTPFGGTASRQVHLCLPTNQGISGIQCGDFSVISNCSSVDSPFTAVRPPSYTPCAQPVRSSKRKQDLLTLAGGSSANVGLEGFTSSPPVSDDYDDLPSVKTSYPVDARNCFAENSESVCQTQVDRPSPGQDSKLQLRHSSVVHRLISDCPNNKVHNTFAQIGDSRNTTSLCSTPDSLMSPTSDIYEEASSLHLSDRLCKKLDLMFPFFTGMAADFGDVDGISNEEIPSNLESLFRYQVVSFDFNRRGLIASEDIHPRTPIIEYRGNCLLLSEYSDMYDYRKHYNPFVLFYKSLPKLPLCVDARKYGNEARFIRRSCTPNSEVRHCISFSNDAHGSPVPHLRLVVVASRLIPKSSEITLPFDFDYTACRYVVKCACVLKGCPVTRWFQRMNQLTNPARSPTRHSLVCTRKLPHPPRTYGIGDHLSLSQNPQLNYGEKRHADEKSNLYSKSPAVVTRRNNIGRAGRHSSNYISNGDFEASQSSSRHTARGYIKKSVTSSGVRKSVPRRGRGRGRLKSSSMGLRSKHVSERLSSRIVGRGRPALKKSLTTTGKRPQISTNLHKNQLTPHDRYTKIRRRVDTSNDSYSQSNSSSETECADTIESSLLHETSDLQPESPKETDQLEDPDNKESGSISPHTLTEEDIDADTEPDPKITREVVCTTNDSPKSPGVAPTKEAYGDSSSKHKSTESTSLFVQGKRRSHGGNSSSKHEVLSRKKKKSHEENEMKSKEDVWMAEVLRRIERMEKKRLKQRMPSGNLKSDQDVEYTKSESESLSPEKLESSSTSDNSNNNNNISNSDTISEDIKESFDTSKIEQKFEINGSTEDCIDVTVNEEQADDFTQPTNIFEKFELSSYQSDFHQSAALQETKEEEDVYPPVNKTSILEKSSTDHRTKYFIQPAASQSKRRNRPGDHERDSSSPRRRRRRSQAAMLSDSLSSTIDQGGSREDRWLQMQLRRIAELEDNHEETSQHTSSDLENNERNHSVSDRPIGDGSNVRVSLFEALCVRSESSENEQKNGGNSSLNKTSVSIDTECSNQVSNNQHVLDSEADCGFIVYRTREKDPMAKFSRTRSIEMDSLFTKIHDEISNNDVIDTKQDCYTVDDISVSCLTQPLLHQPPRPTKKRWLSRALMEEDVELANHRMLNCSHPMNNPSSNVKLDSSSSIQSTCVTPVNPKKRMISRLSEISGDASNCLHHEVDENPQHLESQYSPDHIIKESDDNLGNRNEDSVSVSQLPEDDESTEASSPHSPPLPPKKATVKQQTEELQLQEMPKVRVSLTEYRRRRGLPVTPAAERNNKELKESLKQSSPNIDNLEITIPPPLLSPSRLLIELPHLHNESKPSIDANISDKLLQNIKSLSTRSEVVHDYSDSKMSYSHTEKTLEVDNKRDFICSKINERGPRTPSEPPDDDDDDDEEDTEGVDSINFISKGALSSSPEPYVKFPGKVLSTHSSPKSVLSDSRVERQKSVLTITSQLDMNPHNISKSRYPNNMFGPSEYLECENFLDDVYRMKEFDHGRSGPENLRRGYQNTSHYSLVSTRPSHFDRSNYYEKKVNFEEFKHRNLRVSPGNLPPPPPPPMPSFSGYPISSNSPIAPYYNTDKNVADNLAPVPGSLEYFIQRDNEIRVWQESRSYARERHTSAPWHHRVSGNRVSSTRKYSYTISKHPSRNSKDNESLSYHPDAVTGHFDSVEQTLLRIRDSLQAQLNLTKVGCVPPQRKRSTNDPSSANNNGAVC
uniref:SET domain-containing protein n=1 Tax=Trichobilharzia regenti TaxID=157069 RepID=A0AA85JZJ5_TRIRE|nr:unnamed protein product [Trichobilharzia regenti]